MAPSMSNSCHDNPSADKNEDKSFTNTMIDSKDQSTIIDSRTDSGITFSSVTDTSKYYTGSRRSYDYKKNKNRIEVTADENMTKESLLWFQSLRKHWLNSPRTPIRPILPIPPITFDTEPRSNHQFMSTATSKLRNKNVDRNRIVVEKSFTKEEEETKWSEPTMHRSEKIEKDVNNNRNTTSLTLTSTTASMNTNHRERLIQFYAQYNPSKINTIDTILQKYYNREEELFQKLYNQYCFCLAIPTNRNHQRPIVFLEFEYLNTNDTHSSNSSSTQRQEQKRDMIQIQLFHDVTPYTVENFRCLCTGEKGNIDNNSHTKLCYINTYIHRIVPNMCLQGGDITTGDGTGGRSIYNASLPSQPKTDLWGNFIDETFMKHSESGLLSMANNGPNRNNSQFFITVKPLPHLNGKHVVFGKVISGMDVVHDITSHTITDPNTQRPLPDYSVKIVDCGEIHHSSDGSSTTGATWIRASGKHRNDHSNCNKPGMNHHSPKISEAENTRPSDMNDATSMDQVSGNKDVPTSNALFHFRSTTIFSSASNVGCVSKDNADCHATINEVTASNESDVSVMNPKVDAPFLKVESHGTNINANPNTEDTVQLTERERPKASTSLNAVTRTNIASMAADDDNVDKPHPKELFTERNITQQTLSSNRALSISCDTQPTCRTVFEKLMEHETLSVGTCAVEVRNESDLVLQESKVQNYIKSDFSRPNDDMCDNAVAMSSPSATFSQCTKNDESTISIVDTSYCCDTSHCSVMTSASSTSEHVEWLHRMVDEAQLKLRMTRKKLEERMKVLNNRSTATTRLECTRNSNTSCSVEDHNRHDPALSQSFDAMTVPAEVSLNLSAALSSTHVAAVCTKNSGDDPDDVPIDYKFISSLLSDRRSHNLSDGKVNVTLPDLPPEVGVSLLLMSK